MHQYPPPHLARTTYLSGIKKISRSWDGKWLGLLGDQVYRALCLFVCVEQLFFSLSICFFLTCRLQSEMNPPPKQYIRELCLRGPRRPGSLVHERVLNRFGPGNRLEPGNRGLCLLSQLI